MSVTSNVTVEYETFVEFDGSDIEVNVYLDGQDSELFSCKFPLVELVENEVSYNVVRNKLTEQGVANMMDLRALLLRAIDRIDELIIEKSENE